MEPKEIQVATGLDGVGTYLRVWHAQGEIWVVKALTADETSRLAARLILSNAISGAGGAALIPALDRATHVITDLIDQLTDYKAVKDEASKCPECDRIIYNKANMARHLSTHSGR